jgi:hypothetical protein
MVATDAYKVVPMTFLRELKQHATVCTHNHRFDGPSADEFIEIAIDGRQCDSLQTFLDAPADILGAQRLCCFGQHIKYQLPFPRQAKPLLP